MNIASAFLVGIAAIFVVIAVYNWWAAYDHPSGGFDEYMNTSVVCALGSSVLLAIAWAVS